MFFFIVSPHLKLLETRLYFVIVVSTLHLSPLGSVSSFWSTPLQPQQPLPSSAPTTTAPLLG
jgi:hypothetical protein